MRRGTDRLQTYARIAVAVLFLAGCGVAVYFGLASYERGRAVDRLDAERGYQVTATVLSTTSVTSGRDGGPTKRVYRLAWRDRQGTRYVDTFDTTQRYGEDGEVTLWVDHRGDASLERRTPNQTRSLAVVDGVFVVVIVGAAVAGAYAVFVVTLNRRRARDWDAEWTAVEPGWRRQVL